MTELVIDARVHLDAFQLDVTLTAAGGEVLAVLGPNGAGKSTLLRSIAGLMPLSSGSICLNDVVLDDPRQGRYLSPEDRRIGVVFQDHRLFPHLRVVDNVAFGPRSRGIPRSSALASASDWLSRLGLTDLAHRHPRQLSGGQAQRVALARALASDPRALLLDEPLASLDVQTRAEVQGELRQHLRAFAGPVLLVTHDPIEALLLAQRIVVLEEGRVVQVGTPAEVTSRPLTQYVASLVGMNLYRGTGSSTTIRLREGGSLVTAEAHNGPVLAAIRPSSITILLEHPGSTSARNVWPVTVTGLAPLGDRIRVTVVGEPKATVDVTAVAVADLQLAPGQQVWLSAKASDVMAYPAAK